ncbi:hypothetical protein AB8H14_23170 [Salmonella enterica]
MAENAGGIYYDIEMDVRGLLTSQQRVNQRLDLMERSFDKTSRSIDTTERSMSSLSLVARGRFGKRKLLYVKNII